MRPIRYTLTLQYDADGVCQSQTAGGAGNATINGALATGGVATFTAAQSVSIYSGSNLSGLTFTVYGTDRNGVSRTAAVTGPNNSTVNSTQNFKTVTRVAVSGSTSGNSFTVGVNGAGVSPTFPMDVMLNPFQVGFGINRFSGTSATATVEYTFDNPLASDFNETTAIWYDHPDVAAETAAISGNFDKPVAGIRLSMDSAAAAPSCMIEIIQSGTTSA